MAITSKQILDLRAEARAAGNENMVAICDVALNDLDIILNNEGPIWHSADSSEIIECARVIALSPEARAHDLAPVQS
jgi:hypothetical protein